MLTTQAPSNAGDMIARAHRKPEPAWKDLDLAGLIERVSHNDPVSAETHRIPGMTVADRLRAQQQPSGHDPVPRTAPRREVIRRER